jgi:hypothetical protein
MSALTDTTDEELQARLDALLARLDNKLKQVAPVLVGISRDREEAATLVIEMKKRGLIKEPGKDVSPT